MARTTMALEEGRCKVRQPLHFKDFKACIYLR